MQRSRKFLGRICKICNEASTSSWSFGKKKTQLSSQFKCFKFEQIERFKYNQNICVTKLMKYYDKNLCSAQGFFLSIAANILLELSPIDVWLDKKWDHSRNDQTWRCFNMTCQVAPVDDWWKVSLKTQVIAVRSLISSSIESLLEYFASHHPHQHDQSRLELLHCTVGLGYSHFVVLIYSSLAENSPK